MSITPLLLGDAVLFAPVILVADRTVFGVVYDAPAPDAVLVHLDDAAAVHFGAAAFGVGRFEIGYRHLNPLFADPGFFSDRPEVLIHHSRGIGVGKEIGKD